MDVSKYKPGRRLDAMVAMALGWKWYHWDEDEPKRWISSRTEWTKMENDLRRNSSVDIPLAPATRTGLGWCATLSMYNWSTNDGAAFEAALEAGVLEIRSIGQYEQSGVDFFEIDDGDIGVLAVGETAAHCLCLGILAIQPEGKLAEYESWLPEGVE